MEAALTTSDLRNDAMAEIETAREHLRRAMRLLDADPKLSREHIRLGANVIDLDETRSWIEGEGR